MKRFSVITLFPEMIQQALAWGVLGQALQHKIFSVNYVNPREFTENVHHTVDDRPFGGGDGMVMMCEPLEKSLLKVKTPQSKVIYLSPQGSPLNFKKVKELSLESHLVLISGRYGGIDQRFISEHVDEEVSIGDYVLSGGELPACVLIDAIARQWPGVLGHESSAQEDSFSNGLLEAPVFTRPREYKGIEAPSILLSGNHKAIEEWRKWMGILVTASKREDLLGSNRGSEKEEVLNLDTKDRQKLLKFWQELKTEERELLGLHSEKIEAYFQRYFE